MNAVMFKNNPNLASFRNFPGVVLAVLMSAGLNGCMTASEHYQQLAATQDRALTVGLVQKDITKGLSQSSVATRLGSPNIVTRDVDGKETWIYDKVASEASFSQGAGNINASLAGSGAFPGVAMLTSPGSIDTGSVSAAVAGGYNRSAGAASVTQRTLTVVIKFDPSQQVDTVTYHSTKF